MASRSTNIARELARLLCASSVALTFASCKRDTPAPSLDQNVERACASACAPLVSSTCPSDEPTERRHSACVASCLTASGAAARAGCTGEHTVYLACVSALSAACSPLGLAAGTALENGAGIAACAKEHAAYFGCTSVCRDRGAVWTRATRVQRGGREYDVRAELVSAGCGEPAGVPERAAPGAPCSHHSVCSAARCDCAKSRLSFLTRACVDGRCAEKGLACALTPEAVAHDPCRP